jgi:hypothetical protein
MEKWQNYPTPTTLFAGEHSKIIILNIPFTNEVIFLPCRTPTIKQMHVSVKRRSGSV